MKGIRQKKNKQNNHDNHNNQDNDNNNNNIKIIIEYVSDGKYFNILWFCLRLTPFGL